MLNFDDLRLRKGGHIVTVRRSKANQLGAGREGAIPYLRTAALASGPLFRTVHPSAEASTRFTEQLIEGDFGANIVRDVRDIRCDAEHFNVLHWQRLRQSRLLSTL